MGCLYKVDFPSGKAYIGITINSVEKRWVIHLTKTKQGRVGAFYNAMRKYGADSAHLITLVISDDWEYLQDLERNAIIAFGTKVSGGYNLTDGGEGLCNPSPEVREKISRNSKSGTPEVRAKISAGGKGRRHTEEAKKKIGAASLGNKHNLGRKHSAETCRKFSLSRMGNKNGVGNTNCLGKRASAEARAKMSASKKGVPWSLNRRLAQENRSR